MFQKKRLSMLNRNRSQKLDKDGIKEVTNLKTSKIKRTTLLSQINPNLISINLNLKRKRKLNTLQLNNK